MRNGSRGLFWLEPLVEVATPAGRIAYGPVTVADVAGLFDAGFLRGGAHALRQGPTDQIPYLKHQQRLTFGVHWYLNPNFEVRRNYLLIDVARLTPAGPSNHTPFGDSPATPPAGVEIGQDLDAFALRTQYSF